MSDVNLLKEREQLKEGLELVVEALDKLEDGLMGYETKNRKYPTIPMCEDEAIECPSWFIFNALCDTKKALEILKKGEIKMYERRIEELENTIEQAKKQVEELKELEKKQAIYPNVGDTLWMLTNDGCIFKYIWENIPIDIARFKQGSLFFSKEDAVFEKHRNEVIYELNLFAEPKDRLWNNPDYLHYYIDCGVTGKEITFDNNWCYKHGDIYFASKEEAQKAVDFVGEDRVKKYYLRIEGDTNE